MMSKTRRPPRISDRKLRSSRPRRGPGLPPDVKSRAEELVETSHIPMEFAVQVALGRLDLDAAIKRLMRQQRRKAIVEEHGLPPQFAGQVAAGTLDLAEAQLYHEASEYWRKHRRWTIFSGPPLAGETVTVHLQPGRSLTGRFRGHDAYTFAFRPEAGEDHTLHKLFVTHAYRQADADRVRAAMQLDEELAAQKLAPRIHTRDRLKLKRLDLFRLLRDRARLRLTLIEGQQVEGWLAWFSEFELGVSLEEPRGETPARDHLWLLQHAIISLDVVAPALRERAEGPSAEEEDEVIEFFLDDETHSRRRQRRGRQSGASSAKKRSARSGGGRRRKRRR